MDYLKKWKLPSLFNCLTYPEWGYVLWMSFAVGAMIVYGETYRWSWPLYTGLLLGVYVLFLLGRCARTYGMRVIGPCVIVCLLMMAGAARLHGVILTYDAMTPYYLQQEGEYTCYVTSVPERCQWDDTTVWRFAADVLQVKATGKKETAPMSATGTLQVYVKGNTCDILPGMQVKVAGTTQPIRWLDEDGVMDLRCRTVSDGRVGVMYDARVVTVYDKGTYLGRSYGWGDRLQQWRGHIRRQVSNRLQGALPTPIAYLCDSLLLGGNYQSIDRTIMNSFSTTGLIHILSVSGSHIALLFGAIYGVCHLLRFRLRTTIYIGIGSIIFYSFLVGANPPVIRSAAMGILTAIALVSGRMYSAKQALAVSAFLLLLYDPCMLFDISFQLSLGATYGILLAGKPLYRALPTMPIWIRGSIALCMASQLFIWPWQLYYFHRINPISIIAAILVAPLLDIAIIGTGVLLLLSYVWVPSILWSALAWLIQFALAINIALSRVPYGSIWVAYLSFPWTCFWYASMAGMMYMYQQGPVRWRHGGTALLCVAILSSYVPTLWRTSEGRVHVIPLTQGVAMLYISGDQGMLYLHTLGKELSPGNAFRLQNSVHYFGLDRLHAMEWDGQGGDYKKQERLLQDILPRTSYTRPGKRATRDFHIGKSRVHWLAEGRNRYSVIYEDGNQVFVFCNGQKGQNILKLKGKRKLYAGSMYPDTVYHMVRQRGIPYIWYWPLRGKGDDVDPADAMIHTVGRRYIQDLHS